MYSSVPGSITYGAAELEEKNQESPCVAKLYMRLTLEKHRRNKLLYIFLIPLSLDRDKSIRPDTTGLRFLGLATIALDKTKKLKLAQKRA